MTVSVRIQGLRENASWQKKINGLAPARSRTGIWFVCLSGVSVLQEEKDAPMCWHYIATCSLDQEDKCQNAADGCTILDTILLILLNKGYLCM